MEKIGEIHLTPHFTLHELCYSDTAKFHCIDNFPDWDSIVRLNELCMRLELVRDIIKLPIIINSGFRSHKLNSLVNGALNSYHRYGRAVDITCSDMVSLRKAINRFDWTEKLDYGTFIHIAL